MNLTKWFSLVTPEGDKKFYFTWWAARCTLLLAIQPLPEGFSQCKHQQHETIGHKKLDKPYVMFRRIPERFGSDGRIQKSVLSLCNSPPICVRTRDRERACLCPSPRPSSAVWPWQALDLPGPNLFIYKMKPRAASTKYVQTACSIPGSVLGVGTSRWIRHTVPTWNPMELKSLVEEINTKLFEAQRYFNNDNNQHVWELCARTYSKDRLLQSFNNCMRQDYYYSHFAHGNTEAQWS